MSPLTLRRTHTTCIRVAAPFSDVLAFVSSPPSMIELNPLVYAHFTSSTDPTLYTIKDKLPLFGWMLDVEYSAKFTIIEGQGVHVDVLAGGGSVRQTNEWRVKEVEGGVTEVSEEVTVETNVFLMSYTMHMLKKGHTPLFRRLAAKLEGRNPDSIQEVKGSSNSRLNWMNCSLWTLASAILLGLIYRPDVVSPLSYSMEHSTPLISLTVFLSVTAVILIALSRMESYTGLPHILLNRLPNSPDDYPTSEWLNMGYWKPGSSFPQACEALALKLINAAKCRPHGRVLDVGHGCGDSLLVHLSNPDIPRPTSITGITSLPAHFVRAKTRITELQASSAEARQVIVDLHQGDAVYRPSQSGSGHPLDPNTTSPPFDSILALDCAYHFLTRWAFINQAYARLSPGGRLALADIVIEGRRASWLNSVFRLMPWENSISIQEYVQQLHSTGFVDIVIEDISQHVFPGLTSFLTHRGSGWAVFGRVMGWFASGGARFVVAHGVKPGQYANTS